MGGLTIQYARLPETKRNSPLRIQRKKSSQQIKSPADIILFLQRTIGNQAVQRLIKSGTLQAKLRIGQPGDVYEQEADRVADEVMLMPEPEPGVQRQVKPEEEERLQSKPLANQITPLVQVQRQEELEEEEEEVLQTRKISGENTDITPDLESKIQAIRGGGQPLQEYERAFFEPRFGHDFSQVRVHTDVKAAESTRAVNAQAFTIGRDVIFGAGRYAPETSKGKGLMAHELTHVVQQETQSGKNNIQRSPTSRIIALISVNLTDQKVSWIYNDGTKSKTYECSTGAGLCGDHCKYINKKGSACTPVIPIPVPVCKRYRHRKYKYWIEFECNRKIAFHHYNKVDGCPWSHGCVRLHEDAARLLYKGSRKNRTFVIVFGTPNIRRCWTSSTGGVCWVRDKITPTKKTNRRCGWNDCYEPYPKHLLPEKDGYSGKKRKRRRPLPRRRPPLRHDAPPKRRPLPRNRAPLRGP